MSAAHLDGTGDDTGGNTGRPLRIALVTSSYDYIKDGVALTLNRLVAYLEAHDVEVLVFAPTIAKPAFAGAGRVVPVSSIPLPARPEYRLALGMPQSVRRQLKQFAPDIIHIAVPDLLGYRALKLARQWRIPAVASYHTRYETYLKHYWYIASFTGIVARYLRWFYGACREVYVPSASMAETLRADGLRDNFRLWPRGIDGARFHPDKRSQAWRARHGIGTAELVILHVSRLVREKRTDLLAEIFSQAQAIGIGHKAVIVGDGPERAALQASLPGAIFTGFLDGEDLAAAYASSDIFLFPSETESFGNVTLEAMASGLPCICADATGSRSLVLPGVTGLLAEPGCLPQFVGHIASLARDGALRRRMGVAARAHSLAFGWNETMARILGYYRAVLAGVPSSADAGS
jgi:glycosyltransferase involved in cell wall biosynthesis